MTAVPMIFVVVIVVVVMMSLFTSLAAFALLEQFRRLGLQLRL